MHVANAFYPVHLQIPVVHFYCISWHSETAKLAAFGVLFQALITASSILWRICRNLYKSPRICRKINTIWMFLKPEIFFNWALYFSTNSNIFPDFPVFVGESCTSMRRQYLQSSKFFLFAYSQRNLFIF